MIEITGNLHVHTAYSDGKLYHDAVVSAAARAGLDFIITTDHNVYIQGLEGWKSAGEKQVLLLCGEEIHQQDRRPQKNHLLAIGAHSELSGFASDPQALIAAVQAAGGAAFLAHPFDPASSRVGEESLGWISWEVQEYAGLEIWNYMSEFKSLLGNPLAILFFVFFPSLGIRAPSSETLAAWDRLLASGRRLAAVGGSDAHANLYSLGPLRKTVFSYTYLFRAINMHLLLASPLSGDAQADGLRIVDALRRGCGWVAYDLPARTTGFRFEAQGAQEHAEMGGEISLSTKPVLQSLLPTAARWRIIRSGSGTVKEGRSKNAEYSPTVPGAYRLEVWRPFRGGMRGWIFSNPIYIV